MSYVKENRSVFVFLFYILFIVNFSSFVKKRAQRNGSVPLYGYGIPKLHFFDIPSVSIEIPSIKTDIQIKD